MGSEQIIPHLFREQFGKIVAILSRNLGLSQLEIAEDIASDTFQAALESWPRHGVPANPAAWLYVVANNKAKNWLKRNKVFTEKVTPALMTCAHEDPTITVYDSEIRDSQLQMLFAICHPSIPNESQIGLALKILCGFSVQEIADAFLSNKETINKRLSRAKKKLKDGSVKLVVPAPGEIEDRLDTVLTTLYLLFNEGYYSESQDQVIRKDLCLEAMRLVHLLLESERTTCKKVVALMALMCFHASRLDARMNEEGEMIMYADQDETQWNQELIARGTHYLINASGDDKISRYHLEAAIAYWHTKKEDTKSKWENILRLYDQLLQLEYSPIASLNRVFVISKIFDVDTAIIYALKLDLSDNHYYHFLLGMLYCKKDCEKAKAYFQKALVLAKSKTDKRTIRKQMQKCN